MACGSAPSETPTAQPTLPLPTARPTATPRATPTFAPATLPPPKEPLITPTPVTYIVQEGDTLIPIANKFGVGVQELIAANGNLDPRFLRVGQRLVIPVGGNAAASNTTGGQILPSPTPVPFEIRGLNIIRTAAGSVECLGEIFNNSPTAVTNVQIQVTLQDEAGTPLVGTSQFVARDVIAPNETSPFRVLFTVPPPTFVKFDVRALRAEATTANNFAKVQVGKLQGVPSGVQFRVTGEVTNADTSAANDLRLIVTAYDAEKRVIGYRYVSSQPLAAGASQPFELSIVTSSQTIASFAIVAEGLK